MRRSSTLFISEYTDYGEAYSRAVASGFPVGVAVHLSLPVVLADFPSSALLAPASSPIVLAEANPSALLAPTPSPPVLADAPDRKSVV